MKLLIYIPTYNRPVALRNLLNSLIKQSFEFSDKLRIFINDNNSDNQVNDSIIDEYKNCNLLYFRKNTCNVGGNANMMLGFIFARQDEYLWILGDDDYLEDSALKQIFSVIGNNSDLIIFSKTNNTFETSYNIHKSYEKWMSFWVSSNIFKVETFNKFVHSTFHYHNTSYPHIAIQWLANSENNLSVTILPLDKVLNRTISEENNTAENYSLAWTGAFGLSEILNREDACLFVEYWLNNYGINYFENELRMKNSFDISKLYIFKLSNKIKVIFYFTRFRYIVFKSSKKIFNLIPIENRNKIKKSKLYNKIVNLILNKNSVIK